MRFPFLTLATYPATITSAQTPIDKFAQLLDLLPRQQNVTCPLAPNPMPKAADLPAVKTMPDPFLYLDGKTRVKSQDEWYQCRQPEILKLLQEYQYGYYPDHSQETISATRSGTKLDITITTEGKSAAISATLNLPSGSGPFPVVIAIGGIDNNSYLKAGIAVVTFDYSKVAADSNSKTGSFWTLYKGRDIGGIIPFLTPQPSYSQVNTQLTAKSILRRPHRLGMGLPPRARRPSAQGARDRRHQIRRNGMFATR